MPEELPSSWTKRPTREDIVRHLQAEGYFPSELHPLSIANGNTTKDMITQIQGSVFNLLKSRRKRSTDAAVNKTDILDTAEFLGLEKLNKS